MKKIFISTFLALSMLMNICCFIAFAQDADFDEISVLIEYDEEGVVLSVSGKTPAAYEQRILMTVYKPAMADGLTAQLRDSDNPASLEPLKTPSETPVFRWDMITADKDGSFSGEWPLNEGIENGSYVVVKLTGAGKEPTGASKLFYYEAPQTFMTGTLRQLESLTGDALGEFLVEKRLLLGLEKDNSYYLDNEFEEMFAAIRDNDFEADSSGHRFDGSGDVNTVLDRVEALQNLAAAPTASDISGFISRFGHLLTYDLSENNADYTAVKTQSYAIAAGIVTANPPICFNDVERIIEQSVGIAIINTKDSETVGAEIEQYAAVLGIDKDEYEAYCAAYTDYEVNKAFVELDFKLPSDVAAAFSARKLILDNGGDSTSNPPDDDSDNQGGGGAPSRPVATTPVQGQEPDGNNSTTGYTDLSKEHWAAEAVIALSSKNVINGFADGSFRPDDAVTREQLVKMLVEAFSVTGEAEISFDDVEPGRWSEKYISAAFAGTVVKGVSDTLFAPEKEVSRQDAAVMLARLCIAEGIVVSGEEYPTDKELVTDYAKEHVFRLMGAGVISGFEDGSFRPYDALTRAQAAKLIYGLING